AKRRALCRARQSGCEPEHRIVDPRGAGGSNGHWSAGRGADCRQQPRDRCGLCQPFAEARRRAHGQSPSPVPQPTRANPHADGAPRRAGDVSRPRVRRGWRIDELRIEHLRPGTPGRLVCGSRAQRPAALRFANHASNQIRVGHQPANGEGAGPRHSGDCPRPRRRGDRVTRREFIALLGGAATWPLAARAQQSAMPVIGFMSSRSPEDSAHLLEAFRRGLREGGFIDGENVAIEFRWARGDYSRLPTFATDLVSRRVNVISALGGPPLALAAKRATSTMPIVSSYSADTTGLVESFNRPGGNVTGFALETDLMDPKRLGLLRDLARRGSFSSERSSIRITLR